MIVTWDRPVHFLGYYLDIRVERLGKARKLSVRKEDLILGTLLRQNLQCKASRVVTLQNVAGNRGMKV
jgi:hypothetical protein